MFYALAASCVLQAWLAVSAYADGGNTLPFDAGEWAPLANTIGLILLFVLQQRKERTASHERSYIAQQISATKEVAKVSHNELADVLEDVPFDRQPIRRFKPKEGEANGE